MSLAKLIGGASSEQVFDLSRLLGGEAIVLAPTIDQDLDLIRRSGLFDASWYVQGHPDLAKGTDPARHYHEQGWRLGYRPNGIVDKRAVLTRIPDT